MKMNKRVLCVTSLFAVSFTDIFQSGKEEDSNWFISREERVVNTLTDESIDQFFRELNGSSLVKTPLEVHFLGSKVVSVPPSLKVGPSSVNIPLFSLEDRPIDYIKGGLHAAKNMIGSLHATSYGPVYEFLIGLETTSPLIASAIKQIQTWANQLNAMSIQSYDAASTLMGMWPGRASTYACEHELIASGKDLIEAKTLCQGKQNREKNLRLLGQRNHQMFVGSFDVAEKIFAQMGIETEREFLMQMTGTVVSDGSGRIDFHPPLHRQLLQELLDEKKTIPANLCKRFRSIAVQSQKMQIFELFKRIQQSLRNDAEFTHEEKELLGYSHFPMAGFLTLMTQYQGNGSTLILERYSELIAFERIIQFMEETARSILFTAESLRPVQISGYELEAYIKQVREMLSDLQILKTENLQRISMEQKALDLLMHIEKDLREKMRKS